MCQCLTTNSLNNVARESGKVILSLFIGIFALLVTGSQLNAAESVQLNLSATIEKSCSIDRNGTGGNAATLDRNDGTVSVEFTIDCNTPFIYSLSSDEGGLVYTGTEKLGTNSDTILTKVNYTTRFQVTGLQDGNKNAIGQSCSSETLGIKDGAGDPAPECTSSNASFEDSGTSVAIGQTATLDVSIDNWANGLVDGNPLMAGTFQDELILTISTNP